MDWGTIIYVLTSIGSSDGENSQETLLIMLELIAKSLPELGRRPTINADIPIILHNIILKFYSLIK